MDAPVDGSASFFQHSSSMSAGAGGSAGDVPAVGHEQLLSILMQAMPIVLWAIDTEGTFTYHDGAGTDGTDVPRGALVGKNIFELYPGDEARQALAGEQIRTTSESHGIHWETWMVPVRGEGGAVVSVVGFTLDVTRTRETELALRTQLDLVQKQQDVIRVLSTPIIEVWEGVLTLPMVGVLDSARAADVMEELLSAISRTSARFAILDLTGVEVVDTKVAAHLINLIAAIRLLGAEGVIVGIRPTVAQTMVALGLDLRGVTTQANLRAALKLCIRRMTPEGARGASTS